MSLSNRCVIDRARFPERQAAHKAAFVRKGAMSSDEYYSMTHKEMRATIHHTDADFLD